MLLKDTLGIGSAAWSMARLSAASTDTTVWVDFVASSAKTNVLCGRWAVSSSNAAAPSDVIVSLYPCLPPLAPFCLCCSLVLCVR